MSKGWKIALVIALLLVIAGVCIYYGVTNAALETTQTSPTKQVEKAPDTEPERSTPGSYLAGIVLTVILLILLGWVRNEHGGDWGKIARDDLAIAFYLVFVGNILIYAFAYKGWVWFFGRGFFFFWVTNVAILLCIVLFLKKGGLPKFGAIIFALLMVYGFRTEWQKSKPVGSEEVENGGITSRTVTNLSYGAPWQIAGPILSDCESGDGSPGSGTHFRDGKVVVGKKNPKDTGKWQINTEKQAAIIAELKADPFKEEDNERIARTLYEREKTGPWYLSRACWEPKLRAYAWGGEKVVIVVKAPVGAGAWSDEITRPARRYMDLEGFGKRYKVLWNNEVEEDLPRLQGAPKIKPSNIYTVRFKSRETEAVNITVKFY